MALYGLVAEFATPAALLQAASGARAAGYTAVEACSPVPVDGLAEILELTQSADPVPSAALFGAIGGGAVGFSLQWFSATINYPLNVGGRPLDSWPAFLPITFEMTVLGAALAAFICMLRRSRLPRLMHPLFALEEFKRASQDRFFLCIRCVDEHFDVGRTADFLRTLSPLTLLEVAE
jgi:Alternative complex III, ActD subunit